MQDLRKLVGMVVPKKFAFDKIILFIADFDKKSKRFYIKQDLKDKDMDIHLLYQNTDFQNGYRENLMKSQQDLSIPEILGKSSQNVPKYLQNLRQMLLTPLFFNEFLQMILQSLKNSQKIKVEQLLTAILRLMKYQIENAIFYKNSQTLQEISTFLLSLNQLADDQTKCMKELVTKIQEASQIYKFSLSNPSLQPKQDNNEDEKKKLMMKKKELLMQKFQKKQEVFEQKNQVDSNDIQIQSANELISYSLDKQKSQQKEEMKQQPEQSDQECCMICRQPFKDSFYGLLTYISYSNYEFYAKYWASQSYVWKLGDRSKKDKELVPLSQYFINQQQLYKQQIKSYAGSLQYYSCGHKIHFQCFKKQMQGPQKDFLESELESLCPICNSLINFFIPITTDLIQVEQSRPFTKNIDEIKLQTINESDSFIKFEKEYQEVTDILAIYHALNYKDIDYNQIEILESSIISMVTNYIDLYDDTIKNKKFEILKQIHFFYKNIFTLQGEQYKEKLIEWSKNLFELLKQKQNEELKIEIELSENQIEKEKDQMEEEIKKGSDKEDENDWESDNDDSIEEEYYEDDDSENLHIQAENFALSSEYEIEQSSQFKTKPEKQVQYSQLFVIDKKSLLNNDFDLLTLKLILNFRNIDKTLLVYLIAMKCVQVYAKQKILQDIKSGFEWMENKGLTIKEQKYISNVLFTKNPQYKSHRHFIKQFLRKILLKEVLDGNQQLESLKEKNISKILTMLELDQKMFEDIVDKVSQTNIKVDYKILISLGRINLRWDSFVYLEEGWGDMVKLHHNDRCSLCGDFPQGIGDLHLCMLCGEVLCSFDCQQKKIVRTSGTFVNKLILLKEGNLNKHAIHFHQKAGIYLNLQGSNICVVRNHKNHVFEKLYLDKFGEEIKTKSQNWNDFKLDEDRLKVIYQNWIMEYLAQSIVYRQQKENKRFIEGIM